MKTREALLKIQTELKAPKNQYNNFGKYKYRNIEDIQEAVKPLLKECQTTLTIYDEVVEVGGVLMVKATAKLSSLEDSEVCTSTAYAGIDLNRKGMDIAQSFGSSSSYARKYASGGLFLLDDTKDADATNEHDSKPNKPTSKANKKLLINEGKPLIDKARVEAAAKAWGDESRRASVVKHLAGVSFTDEQWKAITGSDWAGGNTFEG